MELVINILKVIFWFVVVLTPLVVVHEFGHLLISRLFGVKIPEFGVGLPLTKHRLSAKWKGITWSLYPWLLGGFVRIYGDHDPIDDAVTEYDADPAKARSNYIVARLNEIVSNQELSTFLESNSLDYDKDWKQFEQVVAANTDLITSSGDITKINNLKPSFGEVKVENVQKNLNTIKTLVEWEFDAKVASKNKRAIRDTFFSKNWIQQSLIIFGGIIFNIIFAFLLFLIMFGTQGSLPQTVNLAGQPVFYDQVQEYEKIAKVERQSQGLFVEAVGDDSLASKAGIKRGYELLEIAGKPLDKVSSLDSFRSILNEQKNQKFDLVVKNNDGQTEKLVIDATEKKDKLVLGVATGYKITRKAENITQVFSLAYNETTNTLGATFKGIGDLFVALLPTSTDRTAIEGVSGPVGIGAVSGQIFDLYGFQGIIYLLATLSIALAVFNTLPIPALDGGRFIILTLSKIFGKRNRKLEAAAISITFLLLIGVSLLVTGNDIFKFFIK